MELFVALDVVAAQIRVNLRPYTDKLTFFRYSIADEIRRPVLTQRAGEPLPGFA